MKKILVIDDDLRIRKLLSKLFLKNNYSVVDIESADFALNNCDLNAFDIMIVDVMMPGLSGIEFVQKLKINNIKVPVILLTALTDIDNKLKGLRIGAHDYIYKPFEPEELLIKTKNLIELYSSYKSDVEFIEFDNYKYDLSSKILYKQENLVNLSKISLTTLDKLMERKYSIVDLSEWLTLEDINISISELLEEFKNVNSITIQQINPTCFILS
jgi:two-component system phosphate regulon response regulator OmpR